MQEELNLENIAFCEFMYKLNKAITETVKELKLKGMSEGSVSAKITIGMMSVPDENGEIHHTAIFEPKVTHKVGKSWEDKCGGTGTQIVISDDGEVMIERNQITIEDVMKDKEGA